MADTTKPKVDLDDTSGPGGNVFAIFGRCRRAAIEAGWSTERWNTWLEEAKCGSYEDVLAKVLQDFDVDGQEPEEEDEDDEFMDMSEQELEEFLKEAIVSFADENDIGRVRVLTFGECSMLTMNKGLVLRIKDSEFQLTIVRSR